jgi:type II secretory pathway pseudopilin PulG
LVELLVVMTIIIIIASITAAVLPSILRNGKAGQGANLIQGMLLAAKQRAIRDRMPAGVRFVIQQDTVTAPSGMRRLVSTELDYVVQPDDFVVTGDSLTISGSTTPFTAQSTTMDFGGGLGVGSANVVAEEQPVQIGDFLELAGGGLVTSIVGVQQTGGTGPYNQLKINSNPSTGFPVTDYRVIRGPRRAPGEDSVKLPADVAVLIADLPTTATGFGNYTYYSLNVPARKVPFGSATQASYYYEIVFSPTGTVTGLGTSSGDKICLFVRDMTRGNLSTGIPSLGGDPALVVVNIRTGAIAIQPVNSTASGYVYPYATTQTVTAASSGYFTFAQDPRLSGM